jgi:hypothetical protein
MIAMPTIPFFDELSSKTNKSAAVPVQLMYEAGGTGTALYGSPPYMSETRTTFEGTVIGEPMETLNGAVAMRKTTPPPGDNDAIASRIPEVLDGELSGPNAAPSFVMEEWFGPVPEVPFGETSTRGCTSQAWRNALGGATSYPVVG